MTVLAGVHNIHQPPKHHKLRGFEKIKRRWDEQFQLYTARILPGEYYVTTGNEAITTTLGSCVSACIRDTGGATGGMNHFLLPSGDSSSSLRSECDTSSLRYGNHAMDELIDKILCSGAKRSTLEIKLFGGSDVMKGMSNVGEDNIRFVKDYLSSHGLKVTSADLGGTSARKIIYFPRTGRVLQKKISPTDKKRYSACTSKENEYRCELTGALLKQRD